MESTTYEDITLRLAKLLDALSHPARLQVIEILAEHFECPAGSLSNKLPLSKSTVSQHLNKLKNTGIISCKPDAQTLRYKLNQETLEEIKLLFNDFIEQINKLSQFKKDCDVDNNCC